jgi:pimeloyl-ACP methyl ester carboxylesterase
MWGIDNQSLQAVAGEMLAAGTAALSMPLRWMVADRTDVVSDEPPVVLAHGLCGDPTNFLAFRRRLAHRNIVSFSYRPRLDYQRLATDLLSLIDRVRRQTGARQVDVVGHSLGGLAARYATEIATDDPIRRLVTLGSPYYAGPLFRRELAIFGADDVLVLRPEARYGLRGRTRVLAACGHLALLYHPAALGEAVAYLTLRRAPSSAASVAA